MTNPSMMMRRLKHISNRAGFVTWVVIAVLFTLTSTARAQGAAEANADEQPPAAAAAENAAEGTAVQQSPVKEKSAEPAPLDPAAEALLAMPVKTPADLVENILTLVDLGAAETTRPMLEKLAGEKWTDEQKAQVARAVGSAKLLKLARVKELAPAGRQVAFDLLDAASRVARDPQRLGRLVDQLADPNEQLRRRAIVDLLEAGDAGAAFCVAALADPARQESYAGLHDALVAFGRLAIGPLTAALDSQDDAFRARAIDVLGRLNARDAVPRLAALAVSDSETPDGLAAQRALAQIVGQTPTRSEAETLLVRQFETLLGDELSRRRDHEGQVELWQWDDGAHQVHVERIPASDAAVLLAGATARDLVRVRPDETRYQVWQLLTDLEAQKQRTGYDQPLATPPAGVVAADTARADTALLEAVLREALRRNQLGAALAAVERLGESGDVDLLLRAAPRNSTLVEALQQGDRRLRFAALRSIVGLNPRRHFPGASFVTEALDYFARTSGENFTIVGHPSTAAAQTLAAQLDALGQESRIANNGKELVKLARQSADTQFILVDMSIDRPDAREVLYRLRTSPETRRTPVALLASSSTLARAHEIARDDPLTYVQIRPQSDADVAALVAALEDLAGRTSISHDERLAQVAASLDWLTQLAAERASVFDLANRTTAAESTLWVPAQTAHAAPAVAALGRPDGQRSLVELASSLTADLAARQAATAAFRDAVQKHGLLLTKDEVLRQYDRYNASESADKATQQVLSSILDTIERKSESPEK